MPYCVTLRSRTDARITGWYAGRSCLWSTDHTRQKRFDDPHDASTVCHELRSLCPRNAKVINIEGSASVAFNDVPKHDRKDKDKCSISNPPEGGVTITVLEGCGPHTPGGIRPTGSLR